MTREEAKQNIIKIRDGFIEWCGLNDEGLETFRLVIAALEQPELKRCKDCKWWDCSPSSTSAPTFHKCHRFDYHYTDASEFCSRAERKKA